MGDEKKISVIDLGNGYFVIVPRVNVEGAIFDYNTPKNKTEEAINKSYIDLFTETGATLYKITTKKDGGERWTPILKDLVKIAQAGEAILKLSKAINEKKVKPALLPA